MLNKISMKNKPFKRHGYIIPKGTLIGVYYRSVGHLTHTDKDWIVYLEDVVSIKEDFWFVLPLVPDIKCEVKKTFPLISFP